MTDRASSSGAQIRRSVYVLLIVISTAVMAARVMSVSARHGRTPFLSANDRSRIATVRALIEHGTYAIDRIIYDTEDGRVLRDEEGLPVRNRDWHTIDMVGHVGSDGTFHSYSSKPTLLPTLLAGEYWLLRQLTGATLAERPFYLGRIMLLLTNVLPVAGYFALMAVMVERRGRTTWGRVFAMGVVTFGTFVTTFAVTINNHLPATISAAIAVFAALKICLDDDQRWFWFALAGLFAAFTAANELPALSFFCLLGAVLLWRNPLQTIVAGVPAAALVLAGSFGTNYLAHDSWRPPYAHRQDGPVVGTIDAQLANELDKQNIPTALRDILTSGDVNVDISPEAKIVAERAGERWVFSDNEESDRFAIVREGDELQVHAWDRWYQFDGAYWRSGKETKIDRGEPSAAAYALHCTVGHHGIFSLTPVWLMSAAGCAMLLAGRDRRLRTAALFVLVVTGVVLGFYLSRPQLDRTYGGFTSGLRWMFWFTPMWVLLMVPAADWMGRRRPWRAAAVLLLLISVFSAFYASGNPWTHPWLYDYWAYIQWIEP